MLITPETKVLALVNHMEYLSKARIGKRNRNTATLNTIDGFFVARIQSNKKTFVDRMCQIIQSNK